jgi:hypothetical protein
MPNVDTANEPRSGSAARIHRDRRAFRSARKAGRRKRLVAFFRCLCLYDRICFLRSSHIALDQLESCFGPGVLIELPVEDAHFAAGGRGELGDMRTALRNLYRWLAVA